MGDTAGYSSPIVGGLGALIRDWIRSRNYVPGVSGWQIEANGNAEFNDVVVRGTVDVGGAPNPEVKIDTDPDYGQAGVFLYTHGPGETLPAAVLAGFTIAAELALYLFSPERNNDDQIFMALIAPEDPPINPSYPAAVNGGRFAFNGLTGLGRVSLLSLADAVGLQIWPGGLDNAAIGTGLVVPFQIGGWSGNYLRMDNQQIQAGNAGAPSNLFIQNAGGPTWVGAALDVAGKLTASNLQAGSAVTPGDPSFTSSVAVGFPSAFAGTPHVVCSPTSVVGAIDSWTATGITAAGFTLTCKKTNTSSTGFNWIAYDN